MTERIDVAAAINAAARTINQRGSLEETLQTIVEVASESVPGFDQVGISTVDKRGNVRTRATTGDLVDTLDQTQYSMGEGPCVDSLRNAHVVMAPRIRDDQRWPRYVPAAVKEGLRAQMAVRLYLDDEGTVGGINFYSTVSDDIDPDAEGIADLFAAHAAIAIGHADERDNLNAALHSRKIIGQAIGIIMERYQIDEDRAFHFLIRASSHGNIKLRDVAQEILDQGNQR